ncbi:MAG: arsenate reductase ArsC [Candidatus Thorarchaeota archaeon]|nr:arsenate reductase ArsC [Candidatus Thorarchaeota archaeon]
MKRVLFICTGNSARSQIAEALLRHLGGNAYHASSAGTQPADRINPFALAVLDEIGVSTDGLYPKKMNGFENQSFDLVITVCDNAKQKCPVFPRAKEVDHWSLIDPASFQGTYEEILTVFRETRDEIKRRIEDYILQGRLANDPLNTLRL